MADRDLLDVASYSTVVERTSHKMIWGSGMVTHLVIKQDIGIATHL